MTAVKMFKRTVIEISRNTKTLGTNFILAPKELIQVFTIIPLQTQSINECIPDFEVMLLCSFHTLKSMWFF